MRHVICTVIEASNVQQLKKRVREFTDMNTDYFDDHPTARTWTHYQTEQGGIEYVSLLDGNGGVLDQDIVTLSVDRAFVCTCAD